MSAIELLHEIEALPTPQKIWLIEKLGHLAEAEIPETFRQGMAEAERGELYDMDAALGELEAP